MHGRRAIRIVTSSLVLTSVALTAGAVGSSGAAGTRSSAANAAQATSLPRCPTTAIKKGQKVNVTFWESASTHNLITLQSITSAFNASQSEVHVTLVTQDGSDDTWTDYESGLSTGQLPNLVQLQDTETQTAIDTESFLPVQSCINATHYSTTDYLSQTLNYWKVDGQQEAMPFAVSAPVLYYNQLAFTKAHLNPNDPPTTLPQLIKDAGALKAAGTPMALKLDNWHLETWLATANQLFVNHDNGRSGRTTKAIFDTKTAKEIYTDLDTLVKSGDADTNPSSGPDEFDNLLGIGNGKYAMTIDTSGDLGTVAALAGGKKYTNVKLGVGPFPALSASIHGGIEPGGSALYISEKGSTPAQIEGSWKFMQYLLDTQNMASWAAATGFIPVRNSSVNSSTIKNLWATSPGFKVAFEEIRNSASDSATAGSVIGPYADVRLDELNAETSMLTGGVSPSQALATALQSVNATISSYNQRLGVS